MTCQGCGLDLPRGAVHLNEASCIDALKGALEKATECRACARPVDFVIHPGCVPSELSRRGAKIATKKVEQKVVDAITQFFTGEGSDDDAPRERKGRGGDGTRFDP